MTILTSTGVRPAGGLGRRRLLGAVAGVAIAALVWAWPGGISTLAPVGQHALAIIVLGIVMWTMTVFDPAVTAIMVMGMLLAAGVPATTALGGFSSSAWWVLASVLFLGTSMDRTGLARRLAYGLLTLSRATYAGILTAFMVVGFVLMVGVPSMTVRTAIMVPIAWALVQALPVGTPSRGSALIVLTAFEMAVLPGVALLTGSLWGPFLAGLFGSAHLEISWIAYARMMAIPTVAWCLLVLGGNLALLAPKSQALPHREILNREMARLGSMQQTEKFTAAIVVLAVGAWATQPWHHVPPEAVGLTALVLLMVLRVLAPSDLGTAASWPLLIFIGTLLGLMQTITALKINAWFAGFIVPALQPFSANAVSLVLALGVIIAVVRAIEPSGFITIAAFFLSLAGAATPLSRAPLALAFAVLLPIHVFWFNHQNFWLAMTEDMTSGLAWSPGDRWRFGVVFLAATLFALVFAVLYWRLIGAI